MRGTGSQYVPIKRIEASAYTIPTEMPESDGTLLWESTTIILVSGISCCPGCENGSSQPSLWQTVSVVRNNCPAQQPSGLAFGRSYTDGNSPQPEWTGRRASRAGDRQASRGAGEKIHAGSERGHIGRGGCGHVELDLVKEKSLLSGGQVLLELAGGTRCAAYESNEDH